MGKGPAVNPWGLGVGVSGSGTGASSLVLGGSVRGLGVWVFGLHDAGFGGSVLRILMSATDYSPLDQET